MSKNIKNNARNINKSIARNKFKSKNSFKPIETPYYIKENIKKTIDYLFSNDTNKS